MKKFLFIAAFFAASCQSAEKPAADVPANLYIDGAVQPAQTRAALPADTPVRIFMWRRALDSQSNYALAPTAVLDGHTTPLAGSTRSTIALDAPLTLNTASRYDFVVFVNGARTPAKPIFNAGLLQDFTQGMDVLMARLQNQTAPEGIPAVNLVFTSPALDADGNLPHLGSAVAVQASVTQRFLNYFTSGLSLGVAGVEFRSCLPESGLLRLGEEGMYLTVPTASTAASFIAPVSAPAQPIGSIAVKPETGNAFLLPFPATHPADGTHDYPYNLLDLAVTVTINGNGTLYEATSAAVPAFEPGKRYRFLVEMDRDPDTSNPPGEITLSVQVGDWNSSSWRSDMGFNEQGDLITIPVGTWRGTEWSADMGNYSK